VKGVGNQIGKYAEARTGVYRLIAMADMTARVPMVLNRIAGRDETGTLYIGCADSVCLRLQQLVRSLREPRKKYNLNEHSAGKSIRANPLLQKMFPRECLAINWAYTPYPERYEKNLLRHYARCFGEFPPLNFVPGRDRRKRNSAALIGQLGSPDHLP
jgi:hypothetical protein